MHSYDSFFERELPATAHWKNPATKLERAEASPHGMRVLLVDDDPLFCKMFSHAAKKKSIRVDTCLSLKDILALPKKRFYDAAILDYSFGELTALQVSHLLDRDLPTVLISQTDRSNIHFTDWPFNIREYVPKATGNEAILSAALKASRPKLITSEMGVNISAPARNLLMVLLAASIVLGLGWQVNKAYQFRQQMKPAVKEPFKPKVTPDLFWDGLSLPNFPTDQTSSISRRQYGNEASSGVSPTASAR